MADSYLATVVPVEAAVVQVVGAVKVFVAVPLVAPSAVPFPHMRTHAVGFAFDPLVALLLRRRCRCRQTRCQWEDTPHLNQAHLHSA